MEQRANRRLSFLWLTAVTLSACSVRVPDGKFQCRTLDDCPGGDFQSCRPPDGQTGTKYCYRHVLRSPPSAAGQGAAGGEPGSAMRDGGCAEGRVDSRCASPPDDDAGVEAAGSGGSREVAATGGTGGRPSSGARAGTGGKAGSGGAGGGPSAPVEFKVLRSEPADGATLDDPDAAIVVYFSQQLDAGSVTAQTFKTMVTGKLSVAGDKLSFKPDARLTLAGSYTFDLTASIFSKSQLPLPQTSLHFQVRSGKWSRDRVSTEPSNIGYDEPQVAVSHSGIVAVTWSAEYIGSRHSGSDTQRRNADGSWSSLDDMSSGRSAGALAFDSGIVVFGSQPDDPGGHWGLTCVDSQGTKKAVPTLGEQGPTVSIGGLAFAENEELYVLQSSDASSGAARVVKTGCADSSSASAWQVPVAAGFSGRDFKFTRPGVAVWTQTSSGTTQGTPASTSVWGVSNGGAPDCAGDVGCPVLLSAQGATADSPALVSVQFDEAVLWRQDDSGMSAIWSRLHDLTTGWAAATRLSDLTGAVRSPTVSSSRSGHTLAIWMQNQTAGLQVVGASLDTNTWSAPAALSTTFTTSDMSIPAVAVDQLGNGMAVWAQPSAADATGYNIYDIHAVRFVAGKGWQTADDSVLSLSHAAAAHVALAMSEDGRAFASWVESNAVWVGHYD
jgi:Bacterial Ig-like domain